MASALINIPKKARRGEIIEVKTLMSHIMETGYRHTAAGEVVPRNIITSFACRYNGDPVFAVRMSSGIAANPYFRFFVTARESGTLDFEWIDDAGTHGTAQVPVKVV